MEPDPVNTGGGTWIMTPSKVDTTLDHKSVGLHVENMQLGWDGRILIDGLSFEAPPLAWTCLLGESGVGKSTLLRTIADLVPIHPGAIVAGSDGKGLRGRIAYMAQQDLLLPWLTATENVALGARLRGEISDLAKVVGLLERTGIAGRADARVNEMSGGERQRVALARTLMEERPVVLMDEPFSALDAITRTQLQNLAFELLETRTVLMVTHDPFEALRLGQHIHIIRAGQNADHLPITPPGTPLRDPTDPSLRDTYHTIMYALSHRTGAAA